MDIIIIAIGSFLFGASVASLLFKVLSRKKLETQWKVLDISEEEFEKIPQKERKYLVIQVTRKKYDAMTETEFQEFI